MASASKLRMDRSKPFGTVHGERQPGDLHQNTHFFQDGMPFDAHGLLIYEAIEDPKIKALADRKLKKLPAAKPAAEGDDDGAGDDDSDNDTGGDDTPPASSSPEEVNLESWLRGEASYPWFAITKAVRERHSNNISRQPEMVEFLVRDLKIIPEDQVAADLRKYLKD
ncbi:hypothetical protein ABIB86_000434 [Bradyrhizobium sp. JR1.7]|uniref:hypothetical protein n=1 Tax=unclassified Bradyrhizobium TaxID=2631580 RepID=UPI00339A515B